MYRKKDRQTGDLFTELFPFGGGLDPQNRWMKMSIMLPWDELECAYASKLSRLGRPALDARLVLGLLIIKHVTNLSDDELSCQFSENIYNAGVLWIRLGLLAMNLKTALSKV